MKHKITILIIFIFACVFINWQNKPTEYVCIYSVGPIEESVYYWDNKTRSTRIVPHLQQALNELAVDGFKFQETVWLHAVNGYSDSRTSL